MLERLLPQPADNTYRGHWLALWLFGALLIMKIGMSLGCIFNGYTTAVSADGIPLDTFPSAAAQTVLYLFASWGLAHLVIAILGALVLVRYRSLVPLMLLLLLLELLARKLARQFLPVVTTGTPPSGLINMVLISAMAAGLVLSLRKWGQS